MRGFVAAFVIVLLLALAPTNKLARSLAHELPVVQAAAVCAAPTLGAGVPSSVGENPGALVVADFNGDGLPDLASVNESGDSVSIVPGQPGGTLGTAATVPLPQSTPLDLAVADFNADGHRDLAVAALHGDMTVLLGTSSGTFESMSVSVPFESYSLVTGDFTGDAHDDVVLASEVTTPSGRAGRLILLAGDGAGGFPTRRDFFTPWFANSLTTADFNGDGRLDLAATMPNPGSPPGAVAILLADGSGGFGAPTAIPVGRYPRWPVGGDLNADGRTDIVLVNQVDKTVSVLIGDGAGGFAPQLIGVGGQPGGVEIADVNLDAFPDIVVTNVLTIPGPPQDRPMGVVQIAPGDGTGSFGALTTAFAGSTPQSPGAADFNGDGRVDLAISDRPPTGEGQVGLLLNTCGEQADVSVQLSGSADPVPPFRGGALTFTADVTNNGPHAVPVVLQLALVPAFTLEQVTVTQGRCRPATDREPFFDAVLTCWLGTLPAVSPGNTARVTLSLMTQWDGAHLTLAKAFSGGFDPALSDNAAGVTTRVGFMGGSSLILRYAPGGTQVSLEWSTGDFQTGYYVARYVGGTRTILPEGAPLPPPTTSFTDASPVFGQVNCYVVGVLGDASAVVGSSNGVCVQPGSATGAAPSTFLIRDYGDSRAQLGWTGPGGHTGYVLVAQPLNGEPQRRIQLASTKSSYIDSVSVATCYLLAPYNGTTELGRSDKFCFTPGLRDYEW
jgi:VCBS repeat protein/uncharacterized protein DUF11